MFPAFAVASWATYDPLAPSLLADNFQTWYAAKNNTSTRIEKVKTLPEKDVQPSLSAREAFLALIRSPNFTPNHSPATSFTSSFSSFSSTSLTSLSTSTSVSNEHFEIRPSPKGGLGTFAVTNIPAKTNIIEEEPIFTCPPSAEIDWIVEDLPRQLRDQYYSLSYWAGVGKNRADAIFKTNRFTTGNANSVFAACSRFNHACHPHTTCTYRWDEEQKKLIVSTTRDVIAGEELTISYMGWSVDRKLLKRNYGFDCDCPGCQKTKEGLPSLAISHAAVADGPEIEWALYS